MDRGFSTHNGINEFFTVPFKKNCLNILVYSPSNSSSTCSTFHGKRIKGMRYGKASPINNRAKIVGDHYSSSSFLGSLIKSCIKVSFEHTYWCWPPRSRRGGFIIIRLNHRGSGFNKRFEIRFCSHHCIIRMLLNSTEDKLFLAFQILQ